MLLRCVWCCFVFVVDCLFYVVCVVGLFVCVVVVVVIFVVLWCVVFCCVCCVWDCGVIVL